MFGREVRNRRPVLLIKGEGPILGVDRDAAVATFDSPGSKTVIVGRTDAKTRLDLFQQERQDPEKIVVLLSQQKGNIRAIVEADRRGWGIEIVSKDELLAKGGTCAVSNSTSSVRPPAPTSETVSISTNGQTSIANSTPPAPSRPDVSNFIFSKPIGTGGFGTTWIVQFVACLIYRALKVVNGPFGEREMAGLHPYMQICHRYPHLLLPIHDIGTTENGIYFVTELADCMIGARAIDPAIYQPHTLDKELIGGRMSPKKSARIIKRLLRQVALLHKHKLIHGDIKPANVIFYSRKVFLIDFSLVSAMSHVPTFDGTKGYVPPEGHASGQGDIYAIGKLFYQLLTGTVALPRELKEHEVEDVTLWQIIEKACADKEYRYQRAEEMIADLQHWEKSV